MKLFKSKQMPGMTNALAAQSQAAQAPQQSAQQSKKKTKLTFGQAFKKGALVSLAIAGVGALAVTGISIAMGAPLTAALVSGTLAIPTLGMPAAIVSVFKTRHWGGMMGSLLAVGALAAVTQPVAQVARGLTTMSDFAAHDMPNNPNRFKGLKLTETYNQNAARDQHHLKTAAAQPAPKAASLNR